MKKINIELAKQGKSVCTRDGRKARIICFDAVSKGNYPIIALIEDNGYEVVFYYNENGESNIGPDFDLMMLPEKHEGWVNIIKTKQSGKVITCPTIYDTKEDAVNGMSNDVKRQYHIATVKIKWDE